MSNKVHNSQTCNIRKDGYNDIEFIQCTQKNFSRFEFIYKNSNFLIKHL